MFCRCLGESVLSIDPHWSTHARVSLPLIHVKTKCSLQGGSPLLWYGGPLSIVNRSQARSPINSQDDHALPITTELSRWCWSLGAGSMDSLGRPMSTPKFGPKTNLCNLQSNLMIWMHYEIFWLFLFMQIDGNYICGIELYTILHVIYFVLVYPMSKSWSAIANHKE
jgi:hypothetical protein